MPGSRRGSGGGGGALRTSAAPRLHLPASSKPRSPHCPLGGYPEWPKRGLSAGQKRHLAPAPPLPEFRPPALRPCGRLEPPITGLNGPDRASRGGSGPGCAPGNHRGALAVRRAPLTAIALCIHPGRRGVAVSRPAGPDARATRERRFATPDHPCRPAPLCRTRPTGRSPSRLRRLLEPRLCEAPRPGDRLRPVPTAAVAARLDLRSVGRRARPTDRPVPPAFAACLKPRPVGHRARAATCTPPLPVPSPLV